MTEGRVSASGIATAARIEFDEPATPRCAHAAIGVELPGDSGESEIASPAPAGESSTLDVSRETVTQRDNHQPGRKSKRRPVSAAQARWEAYFLHGLDHSEP